LSDKKPHSFSIKSAETAPVRNQTTAYPSPGAEPKAKHHAQLRVYRSYIYKMGIIHTYIYTHNMFGLKKTG
jgi:hypothetical protein